MRLGGVGDSKFPLSMLPKTFLLIAHRSVLPNLRELVARGSWLQSDYAIPILLSILSPTVRRIYIGSSLKIRRMSLTLFEEYLETISQQCPELETLIVRPSTDFKVLSSSCFDSLGKLLKLRSLLMSSSLCGGENLSRILIRPLPQLKGLDLQGVTSGIYPRSFLSYHSQSLNEGFELRLRGKWDELTNGLNDFPLETHTLRKLSLILKINDENTESIEGDVYDFLSDTFLLLESLHLEFLIMMKEQILCVVHSNNYWDSSILQS